MAQATYAEKNLSIGLESDVELGKPMPLAMGDAILCYSVFQNLVKNACEAAPAGTRVGVKVFDLSPLRIVVKNKGAVPKEIRDRFFDKFVTMGKPGGTGMGTYSARLLTQAQGGTTDLDVSDEDNTTAIIVSLPRL